jgi:acetoin utilization deacetylase AcuC-like enzyme
VTVLFATHPAYLEHLAGPRHPERPERLDAVLEGVRRAGVDDAMAPLEPLAAERTDLERVHPLWYLERMETLCAAGGGRLDPDTYASRGSFEAARLAAGAGLTAVGALRAGRGDSAFCAVRPPGHHASGTESMGFCMISNVAVVAAALADEGERVMVLDYDAHHGNGTQAVFYDDPRVLFVSYHQWPLYPGTGWLDETGSGAGAGTTINIPLPAGTTGDVYLRAFDEIVAPVAERFAPTWLIISAGFDAHRDDPLTEMGLAAGDYAPLTARAMALVPVGRQLVMLEGGYDLDALANCAAAVMRELAGVSASLRVPGGTSATEAPTSAGPGAQAVDAVISHWQQQGWL